MSSNCEGYIYIVVLLQNCNETWRVNFIQAYTIYMIETAVAVDEIFTTAGTIYIHEAFTDQNNITDINIVYFITNL